MFLFSLSHSFRQYSAHEELLGVLRFQGEEDWANALGNPPYGNRLGRYHLKSRLVQTSADGESWRELAREESNDQLNGKSFTGRCAGAGGGECHFIRLVNIGSNHFGNDILAISA
jgi:hypothetical protein